MCTYHSLTELPKAGAITWAGEGLGHNLPCSQTQLSCRAETLHFCADVYECHYWSRALHERSVPFKVQTAKVAATSDKHCLFKVFGRLLTVQPLPVY